MDDSGCQVRWWGMTMWLCFLILYVTFALTALKIDARLDRIEQQLKEAK